MEAIRYLKLEVELTYPIFHRLLGNVQSLSNLLVVQAFRNQEKDLPVAAAAGGGGSVKRRLHFRNEEIAPCARR